MIMGEEGRSYHALSKGHFDKLSNRSYGKGIQDKYQHGESNGQESGTLNESGIIQCRCQQNVTSGCRMDSAQTRYGQERALNPKPNSQLLQVSKVYRLGRWGSWDWLVEFPEGPRTQIIGF